MANKYKEQNSDVCIIKILYVLNIMHLQISVFTRYNILKSTQHKPRGAEWERNKFLLYKESEG